MIDREKVIKGFTVCSKHGLLNGEDCHGHYEYTDNLADIIKANDYSKQCPYNGCETGCVKTLAKNALTLLKEQEAVSAHWDDDTGHWIEGDRNGIDQHTRTTGEMIDTFRCSWCGFYQYWKTPFCPNCGAKMKKEGR